MLLIIILFSCEEKGLLLSCEDCVIDEPVTANLEIRIESGLPNPVQISVYEGNIEDDNLVFSTTTNSSTFTHNVKINRKYTVTATYVLPSSKTYVAVDSAIPSVKFTKEQCDNPCYWVYDRILDLRLKNI